MAEVSDKQSRVVGEKSTYAIDASGQKGDVRVSLSFFYVSESIRYNHLPDVRMMTGVAAFLYVGYLR